MDQLPHISEESAITSEILGKTVPELGQGTRVDEVRHFSLDVEEAMPSRMANLRQVLKRDGKGRKKAPKVMKEDPKASAPRGTRPYSTFARRQEQAMINFEDEGIEYAGHKFGLPELPLPKDLHLKFRYDPVVRQVTNLLMKDGKLSRAQTV
jgi:small subunit ribosomal protein S7